MRLWPNRTHEREALLARVAAAEAKATEATEAAGELVRVIANSPMLGAPPALPVGGKLPLYAYDRPITFSTPQAPQRRPQSIVSLDDLRRVADVYDVLRSCIRHLKREVAAVPIRIVAREDDGGDGDAGRIKAAEQWFGMDGGLGGVGSSRNHFEKKVLEDLLVIGAGCVYYRPARNGMPYEAIPIDAATIRPKVDAYGWPGPGERVYEQWVWGVKVTEFSREEMYFDGIEPVSYSPFPRSPVEWLLTTTLAALKADEWNRLWLTDGNTPGEMLALPEDLTPDQFKEFVEFFDAIMSGNSRERVKTRFVPAGSSKVGNPTRKDQEFQEYERWLLRRTCYDLSMEVLTDKGWKRFADLDRTERVATRSAAGEFEWQAPTDYIAYDHQGSMIHFLSDTVDCLVTPDHRMLSQLNRGPLSLLPAGFLVGKAGRYAPMTSSWEGTEPGAFVLPGIEYSYNYPSGGTGIRSLPAVEISMADWVAFLGIWVAEGCCPKIQGVKQYRVSIAQEPTSPHFEELRALLSRLPFRFRYDKNHFACNDARLRAYLEPLGQAHEKQIPRAILDLPSRYLTILWDWLKKGDGWESVQEGRQSRAGYGTNSLPLAGDVQELLQKIGRDGTVSLHSDAGSKHILASGKTITTRKPFYVVRERRSPRRLLRGSSVPYAGMVYCVTVPNGTLYVRRNGKPLWCGNCSIMGVDPAAIGFPDGQYAVTQENSQAQTTQFGAGQLLAWRKEFYDDMLCRLGYPDLECQNVTSQEEAASDRADRNVKLTGAGIKSINEARAEEGLDPVEGADELLVSNTLVPLDDLHAQVDEKTAQAAQQTESAESALAPEYQSPAAAVPEQRAADGHWVTVDGKPLFIKDSGGGGGGAGKDQSPREKAQAAVAAKAGATAEAANQHESSQASTPSEATALTDAKQRKTFLQGEFGSWAKELPSGQQSSLEVYAEQGHQAINKALRTGIGVESKQKIIDDIDAAIDSHTLPSAVKTYRGMVLPATAAHPLTWALGGLEDAGFVSTTLDEQKTHEFINVNRYDHGKDGIAVLCEISLPAGTHAAAPGFFTRRQAPEAESELLLARGARFRVKSVTTEDAIRGYRVQMELVPHGTE